MNRTFKPLRRFLRSTLRWPGEAFEIAQAIARDYSAKRVSIIAAALAYYVFLSLFPFLLVLIAAVGYVLGGSPQQVEAVSRALDRALPSSSIQIQRQLDTIVAHRAVVGGLGLAGLIWSASSTFATFSQALRMVWDIKTRPRFLRTRLTALAFLAVAVIFLLVSVVATSAAPIIARLPAAGAALRLVELPLIWRLASAGVSLAVSFVIFLALYRIVPAAHIELRHAAAGAAFAAAAWEAAKGGFAWYVHHFANFHRVYGPIGAIVVLLLWIYVSAVISLVGAQVAAVYSQRAQGAPAPRGGGNSASWFWRGTSDVTVKSSADQQGA
jgi:membrane protein